MSSHNRLSGEIEPSAYRWVIEALIILAVLSQNISWLAPAPLIGPMIKNLGVSLGAAGLVISIIALCIAIFSFVGAILAERVGTLRAMVVGVWLLAVSQILSGRSPGFAALLACRFGEGVGFGLMVAPQATLVMEWFAPAEWPYINMVNALCFYVGLALAFRMTVPIFFALGASWRAVFSCYGIGVAVVALGWTVFGRSRKGLGQGATPWVKREASALREVLKDRNVMIFAFGFFNALWVVQLYTAFLPEYFSLFRGLSLGEASALAGLVPLTGIFAAAGGGVGTGLLKLRKPFLWPVALVTLFGCAGAVTMRDLGMIRLSLVLMGVGMAGVFAPSTTLLMELPGMTPRRMGAAQALTFTFGYAGAFISPFLGGTLAQFFGLRAVMLGSLVFQLMVVVCLYLLPETGPGRSKGAAVPTAEAAGDSGNARTLPREIRQQH